MPYVAKYPYSVVLTVRMLPNAKPLLLIHPVRAEQSLDMHCLQPLLSRPLRFLPGLW
ncbi:MAG: hypothetical protein LZF60_230033 [Nitrospira sp.]|nr:MAG: hypothetical protein LZF60_230033 [Nitrospira sp.]